MDHVPANRREFLAAATLGASLLASGGCASHTGGAEVASGPAPKPIGADKTLRLGLVGVGSRGHNLLDSLLKQKNISIKAVANCDPKTSEQAMEKIGKTLGAKPDLYTGEMDYRIRLLARDDVDAVVIAVPCYLHAPMYLTCFAAGKHFYGEKPMCIDAGDAAALVKAQEKNPGTVAQIGFQRRASTRYQAGIQRLREGIIGPLVEGRAAFNHDWGPIGVPGRGSTWFGRRKLSGDWMLEQACHQWDVLCWAADALPVAAYGQGRQDIFTDLDPQRDVTDYYTAQLEFPNNFLVDYQHVWFCPRKAGSRFAAWYERVAGPKGGIALDEGKIFPREPEGQVIDLPGPDGDTTDQSIEAFIHSVRTGAPVVSGVKNGYRATMTGLLVRKAVYERRRVLMKEIMG